MANEPAFLFFDGDAAKDVSHMNRLERGGYFDIIQAQRKFGRMNLDLIKKILGHDFESVWESIKIIMTESKEKFYIFWLEKQSLKRNKYCASRGSNRNKGKINKIQKRHMSDICESYDDHMEIEIEDENDIKNDVENIQERGLGETITSQDIDKNLPEFKLSKIFWNQVSESGTAQKTPDFNLWSDEFEKIHRIDHRPWDWIRQLIISALSDPFWKKNIRSPSKLRKQINDGKLDQFIPNEWMSDEEVIENISNPSNKHTETPQESTISNKGVPE